MWRNLNRSAHPPVRQSIPAVQRSERTKVWNRVVVERDDARGRRLGMMSDAWLAAMPDKVSFARKRLRKNCACNGHPPEPHSGKDCSTYHYKILPKEWGPAPYNCGNSVASVIHAGFRWVADENAHAKAGPMACSCSLGRDHATSHGTVLNACRSVSTLPWPARRQRAAGTMF